MGPLPLGATSPSKSLIKRHLIYAYASASLLFSGAQSLGCLTKQAEVKADTDVVMRNDLLT